MFACALAALHGPSDARATDRAKASGPRTAARGRAREAWFRIGPREDPGLADLVRRVGSGPEFPCGAASQHWYRLVTGNPESTASCWLDVRLVLITPAGVGPSGGVSTGLRAGLSDGDRMVYTAEGEAPSTTATRDTLRTRVLVTANRPFPIRLELVQQRPPADGTPSGDLAELRLEFAGVPEGARVVRSGPSLDRLIVD